MKISWQHEWQQWTEMRTDRGQKKRIEPSFSSLLFLHLDKKKQRWSTVLLAGILIKKKNSGDVIFGHSALWSGQSWTGESLRWSWLGPEPSLSFRTELISGRDGGGREGGEHDCLKELICSCLTRLNTSGLALAVFEVWAFWNRTQEVG